MRTIFKISILSNVLLLGGLVLLWRCSRAVTVPAPATPATVATVQPQTTPSPVAEMAPAAFRWNQLMCTNGYRAFVANLRAAGCPEATVEDIVRGNAGRAYAMMRRKLGVNETQPGPWSAQAQAQMVAYFLGQSPNAVQAQGVAKASAAPTANDQTTDNGEAGTATLAAFLQNVDLTTPGMTAEQAQQTANLRQAYLAQISGASHAQNNQASSSMSSSANTASSQGGTDNSQTSTDVSLTGTDSGADNSQTGQSGTRGPRLQWTPAQQALILAAQQESILEGLFGSGAAAQYEQYQSSQGAQQ